MEMFGIILMAVGLILMVASRGIYRNGVKSAHKLTDSHKEVEEYMMLVGNGMVAVRMIGFVLFIIGVGVFVGALMMNGNV